MNRLLLFLFSFVLFSSCSKDDVKEVKEVEKVSVMVFNNSQYPCDFFVYDVENQIVKSGNLKGFESWERFELPKNKHYKIIAYVTGNSGVSLKGETSFYLDKEEVFKLFNQ